uniref:Twinfilin n=1 Tax=Romanomermis culicivorax TaxID=13658 RepID=A0A915HWJ4_ROMCU
MCSNDALNSLFIQCKKDDTRAIVATIVDEHLEPSLTLKKFKDWQADYATYLPKFQTDQPCFILFRLDTENSLGSEWLFLTYAPDSAPTRQKMLYASTRATLKSDFGGAYVKYDVQISAKNDLQLDHVKTHMDKKVTVLSFVEYDLMQAKYEEKNPLNHNSVSNNQALRGVSFPVDQEAMEKLNFLRNGGINYVQLSIDTLNEAIKLERAETIDASSLQNIIPRTKARYHFFAYDHSSGNDQQQNVRSVFFFYTIPPSCMASIKDRMLYSSCKASFLDSVEKLASLKVDRKIEIDSSEIIDEDFLRSELYPKLSSSGSQNSLSNGFAKPQGPRNQRGNRRITKTET